MRDIPMLGQVKKETWKLYCTVSRCGTFVGLIAFTTNRLGRRPYDTYTPMDHLAASVGATCLLVMAPAIVPTAIFATSMVCSVNLIFGPTFTLVQ